MTEPKTKTLRFERRGEPVEIEISWAMWLELKRKFGRRRAADHRREWEHGTKPVPVRPDLARTSAS